jgi:hypothetical protein
MAAAKSVLVRKMLKDPWFLLLTPGSASGIGSNGPENAGFERVEPVMPDEKSASRAMFPKISMGAMSAELCSDVVRFSDGRLDPFETAAEQLRNFVERSVETAPELWGDRLDEVAEKYAPHVWKSWIKDDERRSEHWRADNQPLVWKGISVRPGSEVRMFYAGKIHYATIKRGRIIDDGQEYSPSEWASKVADGTSRNAWRDLWFKEPMSTTWIPAQLLRDQAQQAAKERGQRASEGDKP